MARDLNQITIIGNVGGDPEMRVWDNGDRQAQFSVCPSESRRDRATGEFTDIPTWHRVIVKAPPADPTKQSDYNNVVKVERNVKKGTRVLIQGNMVYRKYDKQGVTMYSAEIVVPKYGAGIVEVQPSYKGNESTSTNEAPFPTADAIDDSIPDFGADDIPI